MAAQTPPKPASAPEVIVGTAVLVRQRGKSYRGVVVRINGDLRLGRSPTFTYFVKAPERRDPLPCEREELEPVRDEKGKAILPIGQMVRVLPPDGPIFTGQVVGNRYETKGGTLLWARYKVKRQDGEVVADLPAENVEALAA